MLFKLNELHRRPVMHDHGCPDASGGYPWREEYLKTMFPKFSVHIFHFKGKVRDGFDQLRHRAIIVEPHPFDPKGTGAEAANMDFQMGVIDLSGDRVLDWYPQVMILPPELFNDKRRLVIFAMNLFHDWICFILRNYDLNVSHNAY